MDRIRLVVGEDDFLIREALTQVLSTVSRIDAVRFCSDADSLLAAIDEEDPDVILTDIRMPPSHTDEGIAVAKAVRTSHPRAGVVVLSQFAEPEYVLALLEEGSAGRAYLLKDRVGATEDIVKAIDAVAAGGSVVDAKVVEALVKARSVGTDSPLSVLTARELQVLTEVAEGKSNAAIASSLVLTKRAVEKHINSIFFKLDLHRPDLISRRVKATLLYLAYGHSPMPQDREIN